MAAAKHFDVIVIGSGAAGMMCAATAGQRGRKVLMAINTYAQAAGLPRWRAAARYADIRCATGIFVYE